MSDPTIIAAAGNVLPAALAAVQSLGYAVKVSDNGHQYKAVGSACTLIADDPLLLLGLAKLHELRGNHWHPTETEVGQFLAFDSSQSHVITERAEVWESQGAVHMLCVDSFGDPVEMTEDEALAFAERLKAAIGAARHGAG